MRKVNVSETSPDAELEKLSLPVTRERREALSSLQGTETTLTAKGVALNLWRRKARVKSTRGVTLRGRVEVRNGIKDCVLERVGTHRCIVRMAQLLEPGATHVWVLSVRILDADGFGGNQDLVLETGLSVKGNKYAMGGYIPVPRSGPLKGKYSALRPYKVGQGKMGQRLLFLTAEPEPRSGTSIEQVEEMVQQNEVRFSLKAVENGESKEIGTLYAEEVAPGGGSLRFSKKNTQGGLVPVGLGESLWLVLSRKSSRAT